MLFHSAAIATWLLASTVQSIDLVLDDEDSVKEAAGTVAYGLVGFYYGNNTGDVPGNMPDPYYWWLCGAMFGTLMDYWHYTGDDSYNDMIMQGMVHQVGEYRDYMPANQTRSMGNDDQGFWAMAAMTAAENVFPDPPEADGPQWIALVQGVFNEYVRRWDTSECDGGLRWQVFQFHPGYRYKNSISNGCLFNIAARLARYTGNDTYAEWAERVWDWEVDTGLITSNYQIYDGVTLHADRDCSDDMDKTEWSYNPGLFLQGAAAMWNYTGDGTWRERVEGLLSTSLDRFTEGDSIIREFSCEPFKDCNNDERSFKAYFLRGLAASALYIPDLYDTVITTIRNSAEAAASSCTGTQTTPPFGYPPFRGHQGTACGQQWTNGTFDGDIGVGEQIAALSAITYTLVAGAVGPVTNETGGTSQGDPNAGGPPDEDKLKPLRPVTTGDRIGAGFLTTFILCGVIAGTAFVVMGREGREEVVPAASPTPEQVARARESRITLGDSRPTELKTVVEESRAVE